MSGSGYVKSCIHPPKPWRAMTNMAPEPAIVLVETGNGLALVGVRSFLSIAQP